MLGPQGIRQSANKAWLRALEMTTPITSRPNRILSTVIEETAEKFGEALALLSESESMTYRHLVERLNRYARWALENGLVDGRTVCLLMPNRAEYVAVWLA